MDARVALVLGLVLLVLASGCGDKDDPSSTTGGAGGGGGGGGNPYAAPVPQDESLIYEPRLGADRLSADVA